MRAPCIPVIAFAATLVAAMAFGPEGEASAQEPRPPSAETPLPPPHPWPRLTDEELGVAPPPPPAPPAPAPEPPPRAEPRAPPFGGAGQLVITGDSTIALSSTQYSGSDASSFAAAFSPGLDVFVVRGLSIGIEGDLGYISAKGYRSDGKLVSTTATTLRGAPRLGVNVPLGAFVSWYPRLTVGIESVRRVEVETRESTFGGGPQRSTEIALVVSGFAPLLLHPKPHVFVGVGPSVTHAFGGAQGGAQAGVERTTIGARFVVGGWWDGAAPAPDPRDAPGPAEASAPPLPELGETGHWVFTGELGGGVFATKRTRGDSSTVVSFVPGFDHFVGKRISAGVSGLIAHGHTVFTPPGGGPSTTSDVTSFGGAVRLGGDVPLSSLVSFYPRASFAVARESYDERSVGARNGASATVLTLGLYAPLLLHVARHLFVGFGPSVTHDVLRSIDDRLGENLGTRVGAGLLVGGWL